MQGLVPAAEMPELRVADAKAGGVGEQSEGEGEHPWLVLYVPSIAVGFIFCQALESAQRELSVAGAEAAGTRTSMNCWWCSLR